jgi:magnesium-transporting ATPase (P-type)
MERLYNLLRGNVAQPESQAIQQRSENAECSISPNESYIPTNLVYLRRPRNVSGGGRCSVKRKEKSALVDDIPSNEGQKENGEGGKSERRERITDLWEAMDGRSCREERTTEGRQRRQQQQQKKKKNKNNQQQKKKKVSWRNHNYKTYPSLLLLLLLLHSSSSSSSSSFFCFFFFFFFFIFFFIVLHCSSLLFFFFFFFLGFAKLTDLPFKGL